jgi:hypothetical protein
LWRDRTGEGLSIAWPIGVGGKGNDSVQSFCKTPVAIVGVTRAV